MSSANGGPIVAVRENRTVLDVPGSQLGFGRVIEVDNYFEAAGVLLALRQGRPITETKAQITRLSEWYRYNASLLLADRDSVVPLLDGAPGGAIALGGGAVLSEAVREALRRHVVVWLDVGVKTAWRRARRRERRLTSEMARMYAAFATPRTACASALSGKAERHALARAGWHLAAR